MERLKRGAAWLSGLLSLAIALTASLAFALAANAKGGYSPVAIYGGAAWVFLLAIIVTMPTVAPWVRKRLGGAPGGQSH